MKNRIQDLRDHLFSTIEGLLDLEKPLEIERAKAIADVAQVLSNSAKVECEYVKAIGASAGTGFLPEAEDRRPHRPRLAAGAGDRG